MNILAFIISVLLSKPLDQYQRRKLSKLLSYLLRHHPEKFDIELTPFGYTNLSLNELAKRIREQTNWSWVTREAILAVVNDPNNERYEIKDGKIRAKYGHSIDIKSPDQELSLDDLPKRLFHGTSSNPTIIQSILKHGLKSQGRQFVHLSRTKLEAERVGRRKSSSPIILEINPKKAKKIGTKIWRASKNVFLADYIPSEAIEKLDEK
ncbi:MAG: RNA 2'-phosphotransferase [Candidatus Heimdallarchaeota archaeon]|nr:RNA 2'-phosphotransferase [Candidatus Heimdallarchaeota archaeon]